MAFNEAENIVASLMFPSVVPRVETSEMAPNDGLNVASDRDFGQDPLEIPKSPSPESTKEQRDILRRLKNAHAARVSRHRKQQRIEFLEEQVNWYRDQFQILDNQVVFLRAAIKEQIAEIERLKCREQELLTQLEDKGLEFVNIDD